MVPRAMEEDEDLPPAIPEKMPDFENGMDLPLSPPASNHQRLVGLLSVGTIREGVNVLWEPPSHKICRILRMGWIIKGEV